MIYPDGFSRVRPHFLPLLVGELSRKLVTNLLLCSISQVENRRTREVIGGTGDSARDDRGIHVD